MSSKAESFSLTWAIENFSLFLAWQYGCCLRSNFRKTEINGKTIGLVLSASRLNYSVYFYSSALESDVPIEVMELSLMSSCGEIPLKKQNDFFFMEYNSILDDNRQLVLPNDILTVRYRILAKSMKPGESYIYSVLHNFQLSWNIKNFNKSLRYKNKEIVGKDRLPFEMTLEENSSRQATHSLILEGLPGKDGWTSFVGLNPLNASFEVSFSLYLDEYNELLTRCQKGINIRAENYTDINISMECFVALNKSSPVKLPCHFFSDRENVSQECLVPSNTLVNDLLLMYREGRHSDVTINTKERSLAAHKSILSARSSVFRAMFEKDQMSEGQSGVVDIEDIDGDTMDRMLVFLYSNSLEDLNWKEALKLYYAADQYDVLSLKQKCAGILKDRMGLFTDNACEVLVLADAHSDEKLMVCVIDFISGHREVLSSAAWRELEESNSRLTTKVMREILVKQK